MLHVKKDFFFFLNYKISLLIHSACFMNIRFNQNYNKLILRQKNKKLMAKQDKLGSIENCQGIGNQKEKRKKKKKKGNPMWR